MASTEELNKASAEKNAQILKTTTDPLEKLRAACLSKGIKGLNSISRAFRRFDANRSRSVSKKEFEKGIADFGFTEEEEVKKLFEIFDKDSSGTISWDEFMDAMRPPMSEERKQLVRDAFKRCDTSGNGVITIEDIKDFYDVSDHPKLKSGEWTKEQCLREVLDGFDPGSMDGKVTEEEFMNYYSGLSDVMSSDLAFKSHMTRAWTNAKDDTRPQIYHEVL